MGGESGACAPMMEPDWAYALRDDLRRLAFPSL